MASDRTRLGGAWDLIPSADPPPPLLAGDDFGNRARSDGIRPRPIPPAEPRPQDAPYILRWNEDVRNYRRWLLVAQALNLIIPIALLYVVARPLTSIALTAIEEGTFAAGTSPKSINRVVADLRRRANRAKLAAMVSLLLILGAVVSGMTLFAYAGEMAREEEKRRQDDQRDLRRFAEYLEQNLSEITRDEGPVKQIAASAKELAANKDFTKRLDELATKLAPRSRYADGAAYSYGPSSEAREQFEAVTKDLRSAFELSVRSERVLTSVNKAVQELDSIVSSAVVATKAQESGAVASSIWTNQRLVSELSTRVGSVMILLFLVQILVTMYRYNTRIASYYDARADALDLVAETLSLDPNLKIEDWGKLVAQISPDNVDFGKMPKTPASEIIESIRDLTSTAKDLLGSAAKGKAGG
jgi:hypothetical protein